MPNTSPFSSLVAKSTVERSLLAGTNALQILGTPEGQELHKAVGKWDPEKHPRGKNGRFIELGGIVELPEGGEGRVTGISGDKVTIEDANGKKQSFKGEELSQVAGVNEGQRELAPPPKDRLKELEPQLKDARKEFSESYKEYNAAIAGDGDYAEAKTRFDAAHQNVNSLLEEIRSLKDGGDASTADAQSAGGETPAVKPDASAPAAPDASSADRFKVVQSVNGSGAPDGQWTQHDSGDLEIQMPNNGPTASVSQQEQGGPGTWTADVFASGDATDVAQSKNDFTDPTEARKWAEAQITDLESSSAGGAPSPSDPTPPTAADAADVFGPDASTRNVEAAIESSIEDAHTNGDTQSADALQNILDSLDPGLSTQEYADKVKEALKYTDHPGLGAYLTELQKHGAVKL